MNKERKKEYMKEWREKNKDKIKEYNEKNHDKKLKRQKEYRENNKDKIKEYNEKNKEKIREQKKEYHEKNKDEISKKQKEYYEKNKETKREKYKELNKIYREKHFTFFMFLNRVCKYYTREYYRYISLENYLTIMKLKDISLKRSIMVKLGHGIILEDEAVAMSGMVWTEEDQIELDNYLKNRKERKRSPSKC